MSTTLASQSKTPATGKKLTGPIFHRTKQVSTVGPACNTKEKLLELAIAGVNVFRLNFSHGTHEEKLTLIKYLREINEEYDLHLSILGDLQGPKLRVGEIKNDGIEINPGDILTFESTEKVIGTKERIYVSYPNLHNDVKVGERILMDDGKMQVVVTDINQTSGDVKVRVVYGGLLRPHKGVNLPDTEISLPAITEKDAADLEFILEQKLDWLALSFVRKAIDMIDLRKRVDAHKSHIKILAKIEMPSAIKDIDNIIDASDAIMVARGDMGVEIPVEKIPFVQRSIIRKCIQKSRPVIVATQMMESMIENAKPNRSDITDVANAVLEGTDAIMTSAETAMGKHPPLVVETMRKIAGEVENTDYVYNRETEVHEAETNPKTILADTISFNACKTAKEVKAKAIIGMTETGRTAFRLSSYRPEIPLFIFTNKKYLVNQLSLSWGVRAFYYETKKSIEDIFTDQIAILKEKGFIKDGDVVVNTGSLPLNAYKPTNLLKITVVGEAE